MLPALGLMGLATLAGTVLQVYGKFAWPALQTTIYNCVYIAALLFLPVASVVDRAAWSVSFGAGAALAWQIPAVWIIYRRSRDQRRAEIEPGAQISLTQVMQLAGPLTVGYAVHHLILFIDRAIATTLEVGSVAALGYANHLTLVVGQLSGLSVSVVIFPRLAEQISSRDVNGSARVWQMPCALYG
jgi:putative peptidoglycan lipid II flippase